jgi:hypothetical protein
MEMMNCMQQKAHLAKKFPSFCGTKNLVLVFTIACDGSRVYSVDIVQYLFMFCSLA